MSVTPFVAVVCSCGYEEKYRMHLAPGEKTLTAIEKYRTAEMVNDEWTAYCRVCEEFRFAHLETLLDGMVLLIRIEAGEALITRDNLLNNYPKEYNDLAQAFIEYPHKNSAYVSLHEGGDKSGTTVGEAEQSFRDTVKRELANAVPPMCTECSAPLSESDIRQDGEAPEIGWEYCSCPDCGHQMDTEVLSHV